MLMQIFDWVFECDDVVCSGTVNDLYQRSKGRGLTTSGRSRYKDKTSLFLRHCHNFRRNPKHVRLRNLKWQCSHDARQRSSLLKYIHTESPYTGNGVCKVRLSTFF